MGLQTKGQTAKPTAKKGAGSAGTGEYKPAEAWLNLTVERGEHVYKMRRGVAINEGDDPIYDSLMASERKYRDECKAKGIEYKPRRLTVVAYMQLVDEPAVVPDLFV